MILYLTYNDQPSGVYWSQVTDVVAHLGTLGGTRVRLVAFVSARGFRRTRRAIKAHSPSAWVLPMVPTMRRWRWNIPVLAAACRLLRPTGIIARGVMATWMALRMRDRGLVRRVCFDGRGAYAAEWEEYRIIDDAALIAGFRPLEAAAVDRSDLRIAVSHALVDHWRERYGYRGEEHVVIPCTLGKDHERIPPPDAPSWTIAAGIPADAVLLVYSGSVAGWQSFALLKELLAPALRTDPRAHVVFLSRRTAEVDALADAFPGRIHCFWLSPHEVQQVLCAGDHGILVREDTVTNRVASPTKFAEYLAAGLRIIISPRLGDFSAQVEADDLGLVFGPGSGPPVLETVPPPEKERLRRYARQRFTKQAFQAEYGAVLEAMTS